LDKKFISEVLKSGGTIGALSPSSSFLAKKMLRPIRFKTARCIVEYGPGTGIFTLKLLERLHPDGKLLVFEVNKEFYEALKQINDPRLIVINDSAEKIESYLRHYHCSHADFIVSSLPLTVLPENMVHNILINSKYCLSESGAFIQFQYSLKLLSKLKSVFSKVKIRFTFFNIPPAFVFICRK